MAAKVRILSKEELDKLTRRNTNDGNHESLHCETVQDALHLWSNLLATVYEPSATDRHMTAACNAICLVARKCSRSKSDEVRALFCSKRTWAQVFDVARCAFAAGKNKPALQVLDTLAYLAEADPEKKLVAQSVSVAATEMLIILFNQHPRKSLKEACIVLYFFLRKLSDFMCFSDVLQEAFQGARLNFSRLCRGYGIEESAVDQYEDMQWFAFVLSLLMAIRVAESRSATLKLLSLLITLSIPGHPVDVVVIMNKAIELYSAANETALEDVSRDVLPSLLTESKQYHIFLSRQGNKAASTVPDVQVVLAILDFGKRQGFVSENGTSATGNCEAESANETEIPTLVNTILFDSSDQSYFGFTNLLSNASPAIRLRACELLTFSKSPKVPVPAAALTCLADSLHLLHDDTDAFHRGELLSTFRRFLTRLCVSRFLLNKTSSSEQFMDADRFFNFYTTFLRTELAPHLSYGRHILALDLICYIAATGTTSGHTFPYFIMADQKLLSSLFLLVLDPYDDVRATATQVLAYAKIAHAADPVVTTMFKNVVNILDPMAGAAALAAATNRADHADALGRIVSLIHITGAINPQEPGKYALHDPDGMLYAHAQELCSYVNSIEAFNVSASYALHGNILGVSYIIKGEKNKAASSPAILLQDDLLSVCRRIWTLSQAHLCVDSPEIETELADEAGSSGPKDSLAYAWRALRDSNLLMQAMLNSCAPELCLLRTIGDSCFEQLALLRHRGAFSTVAQTFVLCCQKARDAEDAQSKELIGLWFGRALDELERQADKLTRRSAGLPAMFTALLHPHDHEVFSVAFQALANIAMQAVPQASEESSQNKLRLPQVHALNCIKDVMTASRFRTMTEPLVVVTINMAARCMGSPIWAIKNCGLMLLQASINRLDPDTSLGASEAGLNARVALHATLTPFEISLALLQTELGQSTSASESERDHNLKQAFQGSTEAEFAGLDLLGRLYLDTDERAVARATTISKLSHELWHIRAQAARLVASITLQGEELSTLHEMLTGLKSLASVNECHGRFLVAQNLLKRIQENLERGEYLFPFVELLVDAAVRPIVLRSSTGAAMWLELAIELFNCAFDLPDQQRKLRCAFEGHKKSSMISDDRVHALLNRASSLFIVAAYNAIDAPETGRIDLKPSQEEDVALHVLTGVQAVMPYRASGPVVDMLGATITSQNPHDVRAAAVSAVPSVLQDTDLPEVMAQIDFASLVSRDLRNSQLRLYAYLVGQSWAKQREGDLRQLKASATGFCVHLRAAANDEIEDTTRRAAIDALLEWKRIENLAHMLDYLCGTTSRLEIMSVLYDLLNDDDDEIRLLSAEVAARFTSSRDKEGGKDPDRAVDIFSAAASRQKLRDELLQQFSNEDSFQVECWRRLLGINVTVSRPRLEAAVAAYLKRNSVQRQQQDIQAAANDLFAEEKQNLYIDDVAELRLWAKMLMSLDLDTTGPLPSTVKSWATDGLQNLTDALLKSNLGSSMYHGSDFEMLLLRVIVVTRIFGTSDNEVHDLKKICNHAWKNSSANVDLRCHVPQIDLLSCRATKHYLSAVTTNPSKLCSRNQYRNFDLEHTFTDLMARFNVTLFLCVFFIIPVVVFLAWKFWVWYILQGDLERIEEGLRRQQAEIPAAVGPPVAEAPPPPPPAP
ncbi:hypothetical protein OHC33_009076 [Knufia fluminis]|uniref:DUF2428 domain-containing protein n=1 Tax=Knufia fluminis TaxID=191047 RepID=A0AAN8EM71_9EURO|nr:hypothetical protein OHC33_009076 [Knufia fluminis]